MALRQGILVQPAIGARGGRIVKLMGDGLLAEFPSVVEAVQWPRPKFNGPWPGTQSQAAR